MHLDLGPDVIKGAGHHLTERAAFIRQNDGPGLANEQLALPVRFELSDLVADRRGADAKLVRGILETEPPCGDLERAQSRQRQASDFFWHWPIQ